MKLVARRYRPQHAQRSSRRSRRRWLWPTVTVAATAAGLAIAGNIGWFYLRSHRGGAALMRREQASIAAQADRPGGAGDHTPPASCTDPAPRTGAPEGIVEAPGIGLKAPVVDGDGNAQLAVAVGRNPSSAVPGLTGTVVLAAHDVSWFSRIDHLRPGSTLRFVTPCSTYVYTVTSHRIVKRGAPVYDTAAPRAVLVTCYPLNALWFTSKRYLVYADLTSVDAGGQHVQLPAATEGALPTSLPPGVAAEAGRRVTTTAPLGRLVLTGDPAASWQQSIEAINATGSLLTLYFGALQIAGRGDLSAWASAAPGVPASSAGALHGAEISSTVEPVTPTLAVSGSTVTAATVTSTVRLQGGPEPGEYRITMTAVVRNGALVITRWAMVPI